MTGLKNHGQPPMPGKKPNGATIYAPVRLANGLTGTNSLCVLTRPAASRMPEFCRRLPDRYFSSAAGVPYQRSKRRDFIERLRNGGIMGGKLLFISLPAQGVARSICPGGLVVSGRFRGGVCCEHRGCFAFEAPIWAITEKRLAFDQPVYLLTSFSGIYYVFFLRRAPWYGTEYLRGHELGHSNGDLLLLSVWRWALI